MTERRHVVGGQERCRMSGPSAPSLVGDAGLAVLALAAIAVLMLRGLYGAQIRSGSRRALIFVQQSAETVAAFHCHRSRARPVVNRRSAVRRREVQAAVRSIAVVMINEHR